MTCSEVHEIGMPARTAAMITRLRSGLALEITDVTVMRQNFRPQLEVRRGLEDRGFRSVHDDRIAGMHGRRKEAGADLFFRLSIRRKRGNENKSNNGVTNEIGVREMRATARSEGGSVHLHLRMHVLPRVHRGDGSGVSELRRGIGAAAAEAEGRIYSRRCLMR